MVAGFVLGVDHAVDVGDRLVEDGRAGLAVAPADTLEPVAGPGAEAPAGLLLVLAQDVDGEVPAVADRRPGGRRLGHAHQDQRWVERHRREGVGRHPRRAVGAVAGDDRHAGGEVPQDSAEAGAVDAIVEGERGFGGQAGRFVHVGPQTIGPGVRRS